MELFFLLKVFVCSVSGVINQKYVYSKLQFKTFILTFYNLKKVSKEKKSRISLNSNLNMKILIIYIGYSSGEGKWLTWHWLNR